MRSLFYAFLRTGLWGEKGGPYPETLAESDWEELFRMSREQAVSGVWVDGVSQTACRPPERLWTRWVFQAAHIGQMNRLIQETEQRWLEQLKAGGMEAEVFKGSSVARWYRKPELRSYGDIDLVIWKGWEQLESYLQTEGYAYRKEEEGTLTLQDGRVTIECHAHRETIYNPWVNQRLRQLLATNRTEPELYVACLMLHLRRHVLSYGIGLKQVCDVAVMLRRAPLNRARLAGLLQELHLATFSRVLFGFLEKRFGSGWDFPLPPRRGKTAGLLEKIVWDDGYRLKQEREALSARRNPLRRIGGNACFWVKRAVRIGRLMPGEAFFFICVKTLERLTGRRKG